MTNVKPKHIALFTIVSIVAVIAYGCLKFSLMFRPLGDRGAIYETWETANENFKVKITARHEANVYLPGAYFICASAPVGSNNWREFKAFRIDDANPIPLIFFVSSTSRPHIFIWKMILP